MADNRSFHFPVALLLQEADSILGAAETNATRINPRLPANFVTGLRTLAGKVGSEDAAQKGSTGDVGTLTQTQDAQFQAMNDLLGSARETAKRAFKGNDVKLREQFQIGINKPSDLASVLQRARIVLASLQNADNAAALQAKGWLPADTQKLTDAIAALDTTDNTQEQAKIDRTGTTGDRNRDANDLYEGLLTIQNAASLEFPARDSANAPILAAFRIGKFPPTGGTKKKPATTTSPATPQTPGK